MAGYFNHKRMIAAAAVYLLFLLGASLLLGYQNSRLKSAESNFNMQPINERQLSDGQIIGSGQVTYPGEHRGFQVWLTAEKQNGAAERYILRGSNNNAHRMFVRLERPEWHPDDIGKQGIILYTGEARADFNIVIDGDQAVAADNYAVPALVGALN